MIKRLVTTGGLGNYVKKALANIRLREFYRDENMILHQL